MEYLNFSLKIIELESERFNIDFKKFNSANQITAATANDVNYDITHNRCAYLYRCGAINISFAKDCFTEFITKYSDMVPLFIKWSNCPNLTLSTFSKGPAFDYVALLLSFYKYLPQTSFSLFKNINMITKYGAWRNTATIMQQVIVRGYLKPLSAASFENCKVIQGDLFESFSEKIKGPVSQSDVIIMVKSIKLTDPSSEEKVSNVLKDLVKTLKPEAILFCIDTKPVTTLIDSVLSKCEGKYLLQPVSMNTVLDFDCPDAFKSNFGSTPIISARGVFFVWQKLFEGLKRPVEFPKLREHQDVDSSFNSEVNHNVKIKCKLSSTCDEKKVAIGKSCNSVPPYFPTDYIEPNANPTFAYDSKNIDQISVKSVNSGKQILPSLISLKTSTDAYDPSKFKYSDDVKENTNDDISFNKFVQTEGKNSFEEDSDKIATLTNRITKLTATIKDLLQMNELQSACKQGTLKDLAENSKTSVPSCCANRLASCSSMQHKYSCDLHHVCCRKICMNHGCHQVSLNDNSNHCTVSHDNGYTLRCCNFSCSNSSIAKEESNEYSIPNLVIPLSILSEDFESLIKSSLSKSNLND